MRISDFDYPLDEGLIAQEPLSQRSSSRLMVLDRVSGRTSHHIFDELPGLLREGDLLVLNDTRVIAAKFFCRRGTGGKIEALFLRETAPGEWNVLLKGANRCKIGEELLLEASSSVRLRLLENPGEGQWSLAVEPPLPAAEILESAGSVPLPPYIHRVAGSPSDAPDRARYQTVYAEKPGAVAAPTAGLHFTPELFDALAHRGIETTRVTLHVGLGTFSPVKCENLAQHVMHREWYELSAGTAEKINAVRRAGRRIVAVGTTSVRVLETAAAKASGDLHEDSGWTNLFLYPPADFRVVGAMVTNFHLPRSTLLMLVAAFCSPGELRGLETIKSAYAEAERMRYRFFSYGDAMLIQ
jgi:S-adenosylmethionine:tRNA ribosyltransferase-isomerase